MLTGAYPHRTGIIGNEWRERAGGAPRYNTWDPEHRYIGHDTAPQSGTSPRSLLAESVGDVLRRVSPASRVVAISGKDRGAILPAGRAGVAYIYQQQTGQFASTTYYMREHPPWVSAFHARRPADAFFGREWRPLLGEEAYARSVPDGQPWYAPGGRLPKVPGGGEAAPGPRFYRELMASPFGDALTLDFARAAVAGEALGADEAPDILAVSLSGHDYINHAYGAESRISHDHLLHVDRLLEAFFRDLDAAVGPEGYVALLTSDHGFMPVPEHRLAQGLEAGRVNGAEVFARVNARLAARFGEGRWAVGFSAGGLLLDGEAIARAGLDPGAVEEEARAALLAERGIAAAYTRRELEGGGRAGAPFFDAVRRSFHRERSADVQYVFSPYWMSGARGTTHGSPHAYDTHVPLMLYGPRWVRPGRHDAPVDVADIAPTLARLLGIAPPADSEGRPLPVAP